MPDVASDDFDAVSSADSDKADAESDDSELVVVTTVKSTDASNAARTGGLPAQVLCHSRRAALSRTCLGTGPEGNVSS